MIKPTLEELKDFDRRSCVLPYRAGRFIRWIFWQRWKHAIRLAKLKKTDSVMDFGCGGGFVFPELLEHVSQVYGCDQFIDKEMDDYMENHGVGHRVHFAKRDIRKPCGFEGFFDAVFCMDVLEHMKLEDAKKTVENIKSSLKSDGHLVVSIPTDIWIYKFLSDLTGFKKISMKEPHYLRWWEVEGLFSDLKCMGKWDVPLPYPFCLYKIRSYEVVK